MKQQIVFNILKECNSTHGLFASTQPRGRVYPLMAEIRVSPTFRHDGNFEFGIFTRRVNNGSERRRITATGIDAGPSGQITTITMNGGMAGTCGGSMAN